MILCLVLILNEIFVLNLLKGTMSCQSVQGRIQSQFEGGAVGSWGAEKVSEIGQECKQFQTLNTDSRLSIHFVRKFSQ